MSTQLWCFEALDSWFFRESRPHGAVGASELASLFPPPARTVAGAVRTLIGEVTGVDWRHFASEPDWAELRELIGVGDKLGQLMLRGPFLMKDGSRLYPAPLHLLEQTSELQAQENKSTYVRLRPGAPVSCDLGTVRLPEMSTPIPGAKPLEQVWLTDTDLLTVLTGGTPRNPLRKIDLFHEEPRLGIARDNARRTVKESLLYQTRHIRLAEGVSVGVGVSGLWDKPLANSVLRFGGEGRPAGIRIAGECPLLSVPAVRSQNIVLLLLTHADFAGTWLPAGFKPVPVGESGIDCWRGELHGITLTLHSACIGKAVREGGWDLVTRQPRPVTGLVPAGSVYFCTVDGDPEVAVKTLHGSHIGDDLQLGRGELAVGFWQE